LLFSQVCETFDKIESTPSRLSSTDFLSKLFLETPVNEIRKTIYFCQGKVAPEFSAIEVGIGDRIAEQAIARIAGASIAKVQAEYRKMGDLGIAAENLLKTKHQTSLGKSSLTAQKVYDNLYKIATLQGEGSQELKIKLLCELLSNAQGTEPKTIVRFCTDNMRIGVGEPTIIDALSYCVAGDKSLRPDIERAFNLSSDLGLVAEVLLENGIEKIKSFTPIPGNPIRPALAERLESAEAIIEKLGECAVEGKYDGFRIQVHKDKQGKISIFSRKQEPMTLMFPDLAEAIANDIKAKEFIIEGEAVGVDPKSGKILPFQVTVQRKRKHGIEALSKKIPLHMYCFEVLFLDGKDMTYVPYKERHATLEKIIAKTGKITVAEYIKCNDAAKLLEYFEDALSRGLEGVIAKDLNAPYTAGGRKFAWIKLKKSYQGALSDTIDVVIIGFYYGKGKRTKLGFGGLLTAVYDDEDDRFKSVARVGTGFSEEQMSQFSEMLSKIIVKEKPREVDALMIPDEWVAPKYVVEVNADEITKSPVHSAGRLVGTDGEETGLALRFPRMTAAGIRDKSPHDATTVNEIIELYEMQNRSKKHSRR
jgi:DNA ligase-1